MFLVFGSAFMLLILAGLLTKTANISNLPGLVLFAISLVSVVGLGPYIVYQYRRKQKLEDALRQELSRERAAIKREEAALAMETTMRKRAELLQDILTHDIRNFIQISTLNAETLKETDLSESERIRLVNEILKAEERSAQLVERAKKLGRIFADQVSHLVPVPLVDSLSRSIETVRESYPSQKIQVSSNVDENIRVVADDLLDEAFTNVLSNAVAYTEENMALIEITANQERLGEEKYYRVSIIDHGKGMPDKLKQKAFTRYLESSHGSGLGLSIVYALVVERYSGKVSIKDRIPGDYTKGTMVEMWLHNAG
jgi:signal transduction histidine kinase